MSDLPYVTSKALRLLGNADEYLSYRYGITFDEAERESINRWRASMNAAAAAVSALETAGLVRDDPATKLIAESLQLNEEQIQSLHETDSYVKVNVAMSGLEHTVRLLADTHGAGGGNPIGWPRS